MDLVFKGPHIFSLVVFVCRQLTILIVVLVKSFIVVFVKDNSSGVHVKY